MQAVEKRLPAPTEENRTDGVNTMANIGELIRNEDRTVTGYIAEASYDFDHVFLEKVASDHERAPMFNLMTKSPRGRDVRLGSIWERSAKDTGEVYFGGYLESGVSGYVPLRLFRSRQNPDVWNVVRKTDQRKQGAEKAGIAEPGDAPANDTSYESEREAAYA
jgi:uncharacterized protein (DUF736 family)